jgi:hypothetical protein
VDGPLLSASARSTAAILLLSIVAIESGGLFMLSIVRKRRTATPFQQAFFRAGHAHAGVLVTLSLVCILVADAAQLSGTLATIGRNAVPLAAILMPAGFFFSAAGSGAAAPNRFILLLYAGAASLAIGVASLGIAMLMS